MAREAAEISRLFLTAFVHKTQELEEDGAVSSFRRIASEVLTEFVERRAEYGDRPRLAGK